MLLQKSGGNTSSHQQTTDLLSGRTTGEWGDITGLGGRWGETTSGNSRRDDGTDAAAGAWAGNRSPGWRSSGGLGGGLRGVCGSLGPDGLDGAIRRVPRDDLRGDLALPGGAVGDGGRAVGDRVDRGGVHSRHGPWAGGFGGRGWRRCRWGGPCLRGGGGRCSGGGGPLSGGGGGGGGSPWSGPCSSGRSSGRGGGGRRLRPWARGDGRPWCLSTDSGGNAEDGDD
ncbi:hypothetical protein M430DRAFT_168266 [Amorphotheca resinae ATCC 22711]|uniref:Uncharacterized protein n=1 Tax=Amorphotheca resinae ATCC 22711 TaxID=857342 RepID=A0A2T3AU85_AMORE|nr:hypothetical protein M430DRAFT_168266 [Amorphotheca resinae ATCC 22711]PSS12221.1 hypothetical protein M430DRAFT_168266 [Amorphotheca resinae ATCC 22711]